MLIGRHDELDRLLGALGEDKPTVVVGEAGVGKTTLLRAAAARAGRHSYEGGALSTLSWMEYLPLRRALGRAVAGADAHAVSADVEGQVGAGVLLLDDLQWAHPATLEVVGILGGRLGLLTGVRLGEPRSDDVIGTLGAAGFTVLELPPFTPDESAELLRTLHPDLPEAAVSTLIERTGGNPLLLQELASSGEPSESLRLAMAARLRHLDDAGRDAFGLLALAGRPVPVEDLGADGVQGLLAAGLAVAGRDGIEIRHALLGEVAVDQMAADERRALHARIARGVRDPGEAARHFLHADDRPAAHTAALRAAEQTSNPGERAAHLAIAATCAQGPEADELRIRAALALQTVDDWDGLNTVLDAVSADNRDAQAWACLLRSRAAWVAGRPEVMRSAVASGLELAGGSDSEVEVELQIAAARIPIFLDADYPHGLELARVALEHATSTGRIRARAESIYGTALFFCGEPDWAEHVQLAVDLARAEGDLSTEVAAALNLVAMSETAGDPQHGRAVAHEYIGRCRELGLGKREAMVRIGLLNLDFQIGDYAAVLHGFDELAGVALDARSRDRIAETYCLALIDLGRIDEAVRLLAGASAEAVQDNGQVLDWIHAEAELWGGRPVQARRHVEAFLARSLFPTVRVYGEVTRAWVLADLGQDPGAPVDEQTVPGVLGARPETVALGLRHAGEHATAAEAFAEAARLWAPYHRRGELRCLWRRGEALAAAGDTAAAVAVLTDLEQRVEAAGMLPLLGRIHRSLRACGLRRSSPAPRRGTGLLSAREAQVLHLVGQGLSNSEIASRLGVSRHTVVTQIASASAKLGANNRAHAASLAADLDADLGVDSAGADSAAADLGADTAADQPSSLP